MLRIRRIYDTVLPGDREAVERVQEILRTQFPGLDEEEVQKLPQQLRDPLKFRFRSILFIAEGARRILKGFALLMHAPDLQFCYLDFIASAPNKIGGGIGGALYERVRDETRQLKTVGLFFECLPDDPQLCRDSETLKQNTARLRFYERYGARPIINTAYETPLRPGGDNPPYLVYDNTGYTTPVSREMARQIVRAILERKYQAMCSPEYIDMVVNSFRDEVLTLRAPHYIRKNTASSSGKIRVIDRHIALVVNDLHEIHHVRERGYVESPVRIKTILRELEQTELFLPVKIRHFPDKYIKAVHERGFVNYLKKVCRHVDSGKSIYPYVFPIRNATRPPQELPIRAGYYCIDTFTPLNESAYKAAARSVDCTMTAANTLLDGTRLAYALVRPPGHHAERRAFGGFCYLNSAAIAAQHLCRYGKIAMLDIDYHHGNGTQDIFYERADVLTVSLHGHPRFTYPYFNGFADEIGKGNGRGYNLNIPLAEHINGEQYREALKKALKRIRQFAPVFLVISLGLDLAKNDPTGSWSLRAKDFLEVGKMIGELRMPTLVVQEGGYHIRSLGINVRHFFLGAWSGANASR
jgi:acetoin utilization deacetylase AcuC-like enzyme